MASWPVKDTPVGSLNTKFFLDFIISLDIFLERALEWRVLGQERDGSMLTSWQFEKKDLSATRPFYIGHFDASKKSLRVLCELEAGITEIVQASINSSHNVLAYVVKCSSTNDGDPEEQTFNNYMAKIKELKYDPASKPRTWPLLKKSSQYQVMVQFLWRSETSSKNIPEKDTLLVMIHRQSNVLKYVCRKWIMFVFCLLCCQVFCNSIAFGKSVKAISILPRLIFKIR